MIEDAQKKLLEALGIDGEWGLKFFSKVMREYASDPFVCLPFRLFAGLEVCLTEEVMMECVPDMSEEEKEQIMTDRKGHDNETLLVNAMLDDAKLRDTEEEQLAALKATLKEQQQLSLQNLAIDRQAQGVMEKFDADKKQAWTDRLKEHGLSVKPKQAACIDNKDFKGLLECQKEATAALYELLKEMAEEAEPGISAKFLPLDKVAEQMEKMMMMQQQLMMQQQAMAQGGHAPHGQPGHVHGPHCNH